MSALRRATSVHPERKQSFLSLMSFQADLGPPAADETTGRQRPLLFLGTIAPSQPVTSNDPSVPLAIPKSPPYP